jgi:hypothetical protein
MFTIEFDQPQNLIVIRYSDDVGPDETERALAEARGTRLFGQGETSRRVVHAPIGKVSYLALAFLANLVMAWVLAGMVGHLGVVTIRSAVISALFAWAGFVVTTILVNNAFSGRRYALTAIDAGAWVWITQASSGRAACTALWIT